MSDYPEKDFPWTFYFNGYEMPKWGANWPSFGPEQHTNWDWDVGPRDFYIIRCKIHHVGKVESASPHVFLYAVQEMLCVLFTEREGVLDRIRNWKSPHPDPREVYDGLVQAAFEMRERAQKDETAFWISGYESDRMKLLEAMRRSKLEPNNPDYEAPPHVKSRLSLLRQLWKHQVKTLHVAANSKKIPQAHRKKLLEM